MEFQELLIFNSVGHVMCGSGFSTSYGPSGCFEVDLLYDTHCQTPDPKHSLSLYFRGRIHKLLYSVELTIQHFLFEYDSSTVTHKRNSSFRDTILNVAQFYQLSVNFQRKLFEAASHFSKSDNTLKKARAVHDTHIAYMYIFSN